MSTHKAIDKICCVLLVLMLILTTLFINGEKLGISASERIIGYESRIFSTDKVHTIDIIMDDWDSFLSSCKNEEYSMCSVLIDNESYKNIGIRAKGNTSLTQVESYGNNRYSFKLEFDHYDETKSYHGLDKLSLNNIIQDNTYIKDYLSYQMMDYFGADAPLCSFVYITVNGEDFGLYLAVEGVEDSFLERNYGSDYGELYKPDSMDIGDMGGNRDGMKNMEEMKARENMADSKENPESSTLPQMRERPNFNNMPTDEMPDMSNMPTGEMPDMSNVPTGEMPDMSNMPTGKMPNGGGMGIKGSSDVSLIYSDDEFSSYQNIFDNAKTDISDQDKERLISALKDLNEKTNLEQVVNIDEVLRYFVVHNFLCNFDSYTGSMIHNYYLYEENGQFSMIPWDYNLAFGGFESSSSATSLVNYPIDTPVSGGDVDSRPMLSWIFSDETYTQQYHTYFKDFISSYFDSGYFSETIDQLKNMLSPYVEKDPTKFCTYEEFEKGIDTLKQFCLLRAESITGQLDGSIPSTSDGRNSDNSTLIDASDITISDMGAMHNDMEKPSGRF